MAKERLRQHKVQQVQNANDEAEEFTNYLELLQSLHTECGAGWNWQDIARTPPPATPVKASRYEPHARAALDSYVPGFFAKLFGGAKRIRQDLEVQWARARATDEQEFQAAQQIFAREYGFWNTSVNIAPRVLKLELAGCRDALAHAEAFDELATFSIKSNLVSVDDGIACVECTAQSSEVVPSEEIKVTAGGKVSKKEMAIGKYWTIYQDHICSAAIRVAREVFAALPIERAIVNVRSVRVDSRTGHLEPQTILGVHFVRQTLGKLRLDSIDPSDAMKNFPHRMKFKKAAGFETIEPVTPSEQWVTT